MDFISKLLQRKSPKQGGCGNSNSIASTPVTCLDPRLPVSAETSECELPIQFTREFVEELVENVQCVGDKTGSAVPHHTAEEASHLKLETQESLPGSLPDLLLPEAAFKKHSDTDTDTTEYESAAEPDALSHSSSIVAEDSNVFEESICGSAPTAEAQKEETGVTTLPCGDISILCADLDKLNLNSPVECDFTVHSVNKLECDIDREHPQKHEIFSSGVIEVSSKSISAEEESHLHLSQETATVIPELPEVGVKEQSLNEKNYLCSTISASAVVCDDSSIISHNSVESKAEHNSLEADAQIACINGSIVACDTHIPSSTEDKDQNLCTPSTIPGNEPPFDISKVGIFECEERITVETPVNITYLSPEETSSSHIEESSEISDSLPRYTSVDAVTCSKELHKSDADTDPESVIPEVTGQEHVISETVVSSEVNTTYHVDSCDDTTQDLSGTNEISVPVNEYQDIETTVDLRSNRPDISEDVSVRLLKGGGDSVQTDDKDYKLYENIIEISRLQEKDLEKECCDGSSVKKENYSSEESEFSKLCCNQEEVTDPVSEVSVSEIPEFGNISSEAEKVAEEIFNVSQEIEEEVSNSIVVDMEDHTYLNMDDRIDPFAPKSALRHSPPPVPRTNSPNSSSSRGSSPAKRHSIEKSSPKARSKSGTSTPGKESSLSESDSPKFRSKTLNSPHHLSKANDANTDATHAKHCIEETESVGSGAPLCAELNNTTVVSVGSEDITYSRTNVSREHAAENVSLGSLEENLDPKRESLYVKFDPLWNTPKKGDIQLPQMDRISLERHDDVSPQPERKEENDDDVESSSANQALAYIDKLISLSPTVSKPEKSAEKINDSNCSHIRQSEISNPEKESVKKVNNPEDKIPRNNNCSSEVPQEAEMLNELQELRNMVLKQEQAYTEKVKILEKKIESLEIKLKEKDEKESKLNKKIAEMTEGQEQISIIMEEYERTIAGLVYEKEQEKQRFEQEKENLIKEKDTVSGHLENIEIAFSDVHRKYERSKDIIQGIKNNEETLRASLAEYEATIKQQEQKYDFLKSYATSQLESANQELESLRRSHQAESAKLHAMLKKAEIKASSLEEMLEQKIKENQELTAICDELIGKVGSSE